MFHNLRTGPSTIRTTLTQEEVCTLLMPSTLTLRISPLVEDVTCSLIQMSSTGLTLWMCLSVKTLQTSLTFHFPVWTPWCTPLRAKCVHKVTSALLWCLNSKTTRTSWAISTWWLSHTPPPLPRLSLLLYPVAKVNQELFRAATSGHLMVPTLSSRPTRLKV